MTIFIGFIGFLLVFIFGAWKFKSKGECCNKCQIHRSNQSKPTILRQRALLTKILSLLFTFVCVNNFTLKCTPFLPTLLYIQCLLAQDFKNTVLCNSWSPPPLLTHTRTNIPTTTTIRSAFSLHDVHTCLIHDDGDHFICGT